MTHALHRHARALSGAPLTATPLAFFRLHHAANSSLCLACPANTTTLEDGQSSCDVPLSPGTYQAPRSAACLPGWLPLLHALCNTRRLRQVLPLLGAPPVLPPADRPGLPGKPVDRPPCGTCRYAVVVSFYVILTGLDPEDVIVQVGGLWV